MWKFSRDRTSLQVFSRESKETPQGSFYIEYLHRTASVVRVKQYNNNFMKKLFQLILSHDGDRCNMTQKVVVVH